MDSKRGTQLIRFKSSGEFELTIEGIQLLQSIQGPLGIISVIGPPGSGKSTFCNKVLGVSHGLEGQTTTGIWAWNETLKVIKRDEDGTEYKADILIIDCESIVSRPDKNKTRGLEILTIAALLSSHLVYFSNQPLHTQSMQELDIFAELPNLISIRKRVDSFKSLHEFMPVLTWAIYGPDIKAPEETAGYALYRAYFEKILSTQSGQDSSKIKAAIKTFFRQRNCFSVVSGNKGQYHRLVEYVQQATSNKTVFNITLTGPILCSMVQSYISRLQKKTPAIIQSAFNRAVAAEARKNIEKLYVRYLENMGDIEARLPCSEEELWVNHSELNKSLIRTFDEQMAEFADCEEISNEKTRVLVRMQSYYEELKEANLKASEEKCRKIFREVFDPIKKDEDFIEKITDSEEKMINGLKEYYETAAGPCGFKVLYEEVTLIIPFFCGIIRESAAIGESSHEELMQEIESLKKNREKSRQNEKKIKEILDETIKNYESQLENKEKFINDMQSSANSKVSIAENKVKNLTRELKSLQQELEHARKEKEIMVDMEKEISNQQVSEYEDIIAKLRERMNELERENEEIQIIHEKSLSARDNEIKDLKTKEKVSETATESIQDYSMLNGLRRDISEMFVLLETEQINNEKYVSQMDKIASLQAELNKYRLKEIESRNKLIEEYEEKISNLRDEVESLTKTVETLKFGQSTSRASFLESEKAQLLKEIQDINNELKRKAEETMMLTDLLSKRDNQIESLYNVIEVHKKQFEELSLDCDDKEAELHKSKLELAQHKDDNDILIGLMGYSLEVMQKKRNIQAINLGQIQNQANRSRVIKIFKKFGIPFD